MLHTGLMDAEEMRSRGYDPGVIATQRHVEWLRLQALPLIAEIESAFVNIPRPACTLHVARGLDDEWFLTDERALELAALDPEQTWREVEDDAIETFHEYFTFADAEGWRFYLPACMRYCLRKIPDCTHAWVYWALLDRNAEQKLSILNQAQREAVLKFVNFYRMHAG